MCESRLDQVIKNLRSLSQVRRRRVVAWTTNVSRRGTCDREKIPITLNPGNSAFRMFTIVGVVFLVVVQREPTPDCRRPFFGGFPLA
jgi:hypothetical protein